MTTHDAAEVPRLAAACLDLLAEPARPWVVRERLRPRIAHIGLGAFHRAHQAVYTEEANAAAGGDWGIVAIAPRSADVVDALRAQDHYFSVTTRAPQGPSVQVLGSLVAALHLPSERAAVHQLLAAQDTAVVTLTITEKAYLRTPEGGLDTAAVADELAAGRPSSVIGTIAHALADRARRPGGPVTILSCDNMAGNGPALRRVVADYVELAGWDDADVVQEWIAANVTFPASIVDRIVPATTGADLDGVEAALGVRDEAAVIGEPFRQWVIEDQFAGERPPWELAGALFVADVAPYQLTKLRLLNGAHSLLAYLGLAAGCTTVAEAMATSWGEQVVLDLAREVEPVLPAGGPDATEYARALVTRFGNPAMVHRLTQIGSDGTLKVPERWLGSLRELRARGAGSPVLARGLGAWVAATRRGGGPDAGRQVWGTSDPRAGRLARLWAAPAGETPAPRDVVVGALALLGADDLAGDDVLVGEAAAELARILAT